MRTLTPSVLASLMAIVIPPDNGQIEFSGSDLLVKAGVKGSIITKFDLLNLCKLLNAYVLGVEPPVDNQAQFRDAPPISGRKNK
jgi:hypothetical protein